MNETIDLQMTRLVISSYRIPMVIWSIFGILTLLSSAAVGYSFGSQARSRTMVMTLMLSVSFAAVTFLIFDLDRGNEGWLKVDQHPMHDLQEQMETDGLTK